MTSGAHIRFFTTAAHPCSYLPKSDAITLFADPEAEMSPSIFSQLSVLGFRRSGNYVYRPHCLNCQACISVRVPIDLFKPNRSQRRCLRINQDITTRIVEAEWSETHYALYARYIAAKHQSGDMYPPSPQYLPHELRISHAPFESSQPTSTTAWLTAPAALSLNTPPV